MDPHRQIVKLEDLAQQLGLSTRWLHREAMAGRIPSLKAGKQRIFNVDAVRQKLSERAAGTPTDAEVPNAE